VRLGSPDRHLITPGRREFWKERVAGWAVMDDGRVSEADVHGCGAADPVERAVEHGHAELARILRPCLHIGLVHLDDVRASGEQVLDLVVYRFRVAESQ